MIPVHDRKVLIITQTAGEANFYAKQYGWDTWEFISTKENLKLQNDVVIVYVGNWFLRNDLIRLNELVDEMEKSGKALIPMNPNMRRHKIQVGIRPEPILYNNQPSKALMNRRAYNLSRKKRIR